MALCHPKLPAETIDQIIDDLALDVHGLRACSLTSRGWRLRSQYHLLSSIYIPGTRQLDSLSNFVSTFPLRAQGIRQVRMSISALSDAAILQLLPLVNAATLTLSAETSTTSLPLILSPLPAIFPNLSSLTIINCPIDMRCTGSLMCTVSRFPLLRTLDLRQGTTLDTGGYRIADDDTPAHDAPLPLEVLTLNLRCNTLCGWLADRAWRDVTVLRRLELNFTRSIHDQSGRIRDLLVHAAPNTTLHELFLRAEMFVPFLEIPWGVAPDALRAGPNLKLLHLSLSGNQSSPTALKPLLELARAIAHPSSTAVVIDTVLVAAFAEAWYNEWAVVVHYLEQEPGLCASLTLVISTTMFNGYRGDLKSVEQMLDPHGVNFRYGFTPAVGPDHDA